MARMPAFVDQRFRGFVAHPDLYQLFGSAVRFSEMSAEPALPIVYVLHSPLPRPREAKTVLPSQTAESTKLGLTLFNGLEANSPNPERRGSRDVRRYVVDEHRVRRIQLIRRDQVLVNGRFGLAVADAR